MESDTHLLVTLSDKDGNLTKYIVKGLKYEKVALVPTKEKVLASIWCQLPKSIRDVGCVVSAEAVESIHDKDSFFVYFKSEYDHNTLYTVYAEEKQNGK